VDKKVLRSHVSTSGIKKNVAPQDKAKERSKLVFYRLHKKAAIASHAIHCNVYNIETCS
jgi:hypothetical protein